VNAQPVERTSTADVVSGFLSVIAIAAALFSLAYRPVRVDTFAIILAFVAAGLSGRNQRLAGIAVATTAVCFILGMTFAIWAEKPLF
jgi:Sec-independent protein secretion pathway component TatC